MSAPCFFEEEEEIDAFALLYFAKFWGYMYAE